MADQEISNSSANILSQNNNGHSEYGVFERSTEVFPKGTLERSTAAKLKLEHFYKVTLDQAIDRNERYVLGTLAMTLKPACSLQLSKVRTYSLLVHPH